MQKQNGTRGVWGRSIWDRCCSGARLHRRGSLSWIRTRTRCFGGTTVGRVGVGAQDRHELATMTTKTSKKGHDMDDKCPPLREGYFRRPDLVHVCLHFLDLAVHNQRALVPTPNLSAMVPPSHPFFLVPLVRLVPPMPTPKEGEEWGEKRGELQMEMPFLMV